MSAYEVDKVHIDALVYAGLTLPGQYGPLRWFVDIESHPDWERAFQPGQPWGPLSHKVYEECVRTLTVQTAGQVGAMLVAQNRLSVNHRYAEDEIEAPYEYQQLTGWPDPIVVLGAIACYEYQACEGPEWPKSEAKHFCDSLRLAAIRKLPGYSDAPWEITTRDVFRHIPLSAKHPLRVEAERAEEKRKRDEYETRKAAEKAAATKARRQAGALKAAATRAANRAKKEGGQ